MEQKTPAFTAEDRRVMRDGAAFVGGVAVITSITLALGSYHNRTDILPKCSDAMSPAYEALQPVVEDRATETIGQSATCKVGDQVFRIITR